MEWWQIVLIVVGAVAIGLAFGYVLNVAMSSVTSRMRQARKRPVRQPASAVQPYQVDPSIRNLFAEIEHNRRLASATWSGELKAFQTRVWESRGDEVHSLPTDVRTELGEAYSDMALANSITWLSTEMSRRSPSLDDSYGKLRASIATRLDRVKLHFTELHAATKSASAK